MDDVMNEAMQIVFADTQFFSLVYDGESEEWHCCLVNGELELSGDTPTAAIEEAVEHYNGQYDGGDDR